MIFSHTQINNYLRCPRSYRLRYLDGWQEKETRAAMVFGRCFEQALNALFRGDDPGAHLFDAWKAHRETPFAYKKGDSWDRLFHQGVHLLQQFVQQDRVRIENANNNLQIKITRLLDGGHEFVSYLDAVGTLDGTPCIIDWKTTASRYPDTPAGMLALDPQLISYSWISGISEVALVVFVRKSVPEVQYLKASISEEQRREYGSLVEQTVAQIQGGYFWPHGGIRYPQNGCLGCPHLGLCVNDSSLVERQLVRKVGASDFDWLDELVD